MKKRRILISLISFICLLIMSIGYASISKNLFISGSVNVKPGDFDVRFESGEGNTVSTNVNLCDTANLTE